MKLKLRLMQFSKNIKRRGFHLSRRFRECLVRMQTLFWEKLSQAKIQGIKNQSQIQTLLRFQTNTEPQEISKKFRKCLMTRKNSKVINSVSNPMPFSLLPSAKLYCYGFSSAALFFIKPCPTLSIQKYNPVPHLCPIGSKQAYTTTQAQNIQISRLCSFSQFLLCQRRLHFANYLLHGCIDHCLDLPYLKTSLDFRSCSVGSNGSHERIPESCSPNLIRNK